MSERINGVEIPTVAVQPPAHGSAVNHPQHYQGAHECIDIMRAMFGNETVKAFCRCNAYKYRFRADRKNGAEDIEKAEWYEDYLMRMEREENNGHIEKSIGF